MKLASLAMFGALAAIGLARVAAGQTPPLTAAVPAGQLPPGPGHDTMVRVCSGCHQPQIAAQQRLTREGWTDLVNTMASNGASASDAEFAEIVDYLSKSFPAPAK